MLKTNQSAQNLSLLLAQDGKIGSIGGGGDCEDKTVKKSSLKSKNSNGAICYLISNA